MDSACKSPAFAIREVARALLLGILACTPVIVMAQITSASTCAAEPPQPGRAITLTGFPAERIYIHPKHPRLCTDPADRSCRATAYVIVGDSVKASGDCDGWTFIEFGGKKKITGWVATVRLDKPASPGLLAFAESMPSTTHAVCREVERVMNASLRLFQTPQPVLPSALESPTPVEKLPQGVGLGLDAEGQLVWGATVSEVHIQGHTLKAVSYGSGGSCNAEYLELWDPAFHTRVTIPSSSAEGADNFEGYSSEDVVKVDGQPYFAHFGRAGDVTLSAFDKDLSVQSLCQVAVAPSRVEAVKEAAEPVLCGAVRTGAVSGAPIQDIEPYDLTRESFRFDAHGRELLGTTSDGLRIVARGRLDIDNDGKADDVGLLAFAKGTSSAGCGHDFDTVVPVKLNRDGTPVAGSIFNLKMIESAGGGEDGRLLVFHGKVYFETKSRMDADGVLQHIVWELSVNGRKNVCELLPVQYKAVDAP